MQTIWEYYDTAIEWIGEAYGASWSWINTLDRSEWLVLLAVTTAIGFLCMRGYGSRNSY